MAYSFKYLIRNIYKDTIYNMYVHTIDPHYSGIPYLQAQLLAKIYKHIISTHCTVPVIHRHVQSGEKLELLGMHVPQ